MEIMSATSDKMALFLVYKYFLFEFLAASDDPYKMILIIYTGLHSWNIPV